MPSTSILARDRTYSGTKSAEYAHDLHQLVVAVQSVLLIRNFSGTWTVPTGCAGWIHAGVRHRIEAPQTARARTLYVPRDWVRGGRSPCATLQITPLMRALIDHVHETAAVDEGPASRRLAAVIRDQLSRQPALPLFVPVTTSRLARQVADLTTRDPDDTPPAHEIAAALGVSMRTIERAFVKDVEMTFGEWRQRARICRAIELLAGGHSVKDVALEVGYETPSAFVTAFTRYVGTTPGRLQRARP
jgi:AraC-like DNA-binding protein